MEKQEYAIEKDGFTFKVKAMDEVQALIKVYEEDSEHQVFTDYKDTGIFEGFSIKTEHEGNITNDPLIF